MGKISKKRSDVTIHFSRLLNGLKSNCSLGILYAYFHQPVLDIAFLYSQYLSLFDSSSTIPRVIVLMMVPMPWGRVSDAWSDG